MIRSYSRLRIAPASVWEVAHVSAPPKTLSVTRIPLSAPIAIASRRTSSAFGRPMVITVTSAPYSSFNLSAASSPALSSGFMIVSIAPLSSVPSGLNLTPPFVSGTCLIQTTIFIVFPLLIFVRFSFMCYFNNAPEITIRCTSLVPS